MKLNRYVRYCLFFPLSFTFTNSTIAQPADAGPDWADCDAAIRRYDAELNQAITDACNLMYSSSNLPDYRDNTIVFARDAYNLYRDITNPSIDGAIEWWGNFDNYNESLESIDRLQELAMNDIAERFFDAIEGKDC